MGVKKYSLGSSLGIPFVARMVLEHVLVVALEGAGHSSGLSLLNVVDFVCLVVSLLRAVCSRATAMEFIHFCRIEQILSSPFCHMASNCQNDLYGNF